MADDLGDDWWLSNGDTTTDKTSDKSEKKKKKSKKFTEIVEKADTSETEGESKVKGKKLIKRKEKSPEKSSPTKDKAKKKKAKRKLEDNGENSELTKSKRKKRTEASEDGPSKPKKKKQKTTADTSDSKVQKKKRKLDDTDEDTSSSEDEEKPKEKKKKKRRRITDALAKTEPKPLKHTDLTDAISKHLEGKLSTVEADEMMLSADHFYPCRSEPQSTSQYLESILPRWNKRLKAMDESKGTPLMVVICSAATRAVDLIRELRAFHFGKCKVAKLFAKHMKIAQQRKFLKKEPIQIGVGTPSRLLGLLDDDALGLDQAMVILLDWSWRNAKYGRLIDIKDHREDFMALLKKYFVPRVKTGKCKFALL